MFSSSKTKGSPSGGRGGSGGLSFIGADVVITGHITGSDHLHIDGRIEGDVTCAVLIQGESGTVTGNIVAGEARLAGLVEGIVNARTIALEASARVTGDVAYEVLSIAAGAQVQGRLSRRDAGSGDTVVPLVAARDKASLPALDRPAASGPAA